MDTFNTKDPTLIEVGIGELRIAEAPNRLMTPALGSCVGVSLYDALSQRGALCHIMLPSPGFNGQSGTSGKFADFAVQELIRMLDEAGSPKRRLQAKMAGGAAMFRGDNTMANIGGRNIAEVRKQLELMRVPLVAEDTGEAYARTVELDLATGDLLVRSYQFGVRRL
jgi:chemotaxis protein CheD